LNCGAPSLKDTVNGKRLDTTTNLMPATSAVCSIVQVQLLKILQRAAGVSPADH